MKKLLALTSAIVAVLFVGGIVNASAANWLGTNSPSWNDPLNWDSGSVPDVAGSVSAGITMVGNGSNTFTATITNDVAGKPLEIAIGGYGSTGRVDHRAGTLSTTNNNTWPPGWVLIGFGPNGHPTYNLADTTTTGGTFTGYGTGSGTLNIVDGLYLGDPGGGDGSGIATLNVNTTGSLTTKGDFILGVSGWNATVNLDAGAIYSTNWIRISRGENNNTNTTSSGTLNEAGGSVDSYWGIQVGGDPGSTYYTNLVGTVNLNGGTMTTHGPDFWDGGVWIGAGGKGTFNLNGGTLTTLHVLHEGTTGTSIFNFNGGTLKASGSYNVPWGAFFGGDPNNLADGRSLTAAYVQAGGAIIDTAGFDNYIGQPLLTGTSITDGGLTKNGNGQLEMDGVNTFTGPVVVNGGTLYANIGSAPNNRDFSFVSGITVNNNATLRASSQSLFGWDGSQAKPITVNAGGTATTENGDQSVGLVTLAGGTLASVNPDTYWGSWHFGRASDKKLLVTSNSTVSATYVAFTAGATIEVASGMTLNFTGFIGDAGGDGPSTVIKQGAGTLLLAGTNIYTGNTTISAGELIGQTGGSCSNSAVTVASGATNGVKVAAANGQWSCAGLTYSAGTTYADFDLGSVAPSTTTAPLSVGALTANSAVQVLLRNVTIPATVGNYPLIHYTGTDPSISSFSLNSALPLVTNAVGGLVVDTANKNVAVGVQLVVPNLAFINASGTSRQIAVADMTAAGLASSVGSPTYTITLPSGTSANGGSVITDGSRILYTPSGTPASDSFSYTVSDGTSSATATVNLTFQNQASCSNPEITVSGGQVVGTLYGIPAVQYDVQRSTTVNGTYTTLTANLTPANPITAGADGKISFTDSAPPPSSGFYRTIQH